MYIILADLVGAVFPRGRDLDPIVQFVYSSHVCTFQQKDAQKRIETYLKKSTASGVGPRLPAHRDHHCQWWIQDFLRRGRQLQRGSQDTNLLNFPQKLHDTLDPPLNVMQPIQMQVENFEEKVPEKLADCIFES